MDDDLDSKADIDARLDASIARFNAAIADLTRILEELGSASIAACERVTAMVEQDATAESGAGADGVGDAQAMRDRATPEQAKRAQPMRLDAAA